MKRAIKILIGTHDFSTYRSSSCGAKSPIKKIIQAKFQSQEKKYLSVLFLNLFTTTSKIYGRLFKICW